MIKSKYLTICTILILAILLVGCSPKVVKTGAYEGYVKEGMIAFANDSYTFHDDGTFVFTSYTDSSSDGLFSDYGEGTYTLDGSKLTLDYAEIDSMQSTVRKNIVPCAKEDTLTYSFNVKNSAGKPLRDFVTIPSGPNIQKLLKQNSKGADGMNNVYDTEYIPNVYAKKTNREGRVVFHFRSNDIPTHFNFDRKDPSVNSLFESGGVLNPPDLTTEVDAGKCYAFQIKAQYASERYISGEKVEVFDFKQSDEYLQLRKQGEKRWRKYQIKDKN